MGNFVGIATAPVTERSAYFQPGLYEVELERVVQGTKRIGGTPYIVVECRVLKTSNPIHPVGSAVAWYVGLDKDSALGNIKAFLAVAFDCDIAEVDEAGAEMAFGEKSPLLGKVISVEAYDRPLRSSPERKFTYVKWLRLISKQAA